MKKYVFVLAAAFLANAQNSDQIIVEEYNNKEFYKSESKLLVGLGADLEVNSSGAVTNAFLNTLVFKSFIEESTKNQVYSRLRSNNSFALYGTQGLYAKYKINESNVLCFYLNNTDLINANLSKDLFKLALSGNADYAGQTAFLSESRINYLSYQSVGLGFEKKFSNHVLGLGFSYITAGQYQDYDVKRGELFTAADGTYLTFNTNVTFQSAGIGAANRLFNNIGSGTALNLSYFYKSPSEKLSINVNLFDLGFVNVKNIESYHKDSSYRFEGLEANNLFEFNAEDFKQIQTDTIYDILNIQKEEVTKTVLLPFRLKAGLKYNISDKVSFISDLQYMNASGYLPKLAIGGLYNIHTRFSAFAKFSVGGFGRIDSYIGFNTLLPGRVNLYANLNIFENMLASTKTSGASVSLALSRIF